MNILFIHQNYLAQYKHFFEWLVAKGGHRIVFITQRTDIKATQSHTVISYKPDHVAGNDAYPITADYEQCCANGFKVAEICARLDANGFKPDIIFGHTGWGEMLFVKKVWPNIPVLSYFEYYFIEKGGAVGYDPEFPISDTLKYILQARNATNHLSYMECDLGQTATNWQRQCYPKALQDKIRVIHEGIRTDICVPNEKVAFKLSQAGPPITRNDEVFTFMARNMEPVRGFHIFMRALPKILAARPNAKVLIIGGDRTSYGRSLKGGQSNRAMMEQELGDRVDWSRVHFLGLLPYADFLSVIQVSRCHISLTVPFVPSWSMMESMSMGATLVSSNVPPIAEIVEDGKTGFLVDFLDPEALADKVIDVLEHKTNYREIGLAARAHIVKNYDFKTVMLEKQIELINEVLPSDLKFAV